MDPRQELFRKLLKELAGQLWQAQLEDALENDSIRLCIPIRDQRHGIRSHAELFDKLLELDIISPDDISVLNKVLERQEEGHLLWPLYEAGFGRDGLRRTGSFRGRGSWSEGSVSRDFVRSSRELTATVSGVSSLHELAVPPLQHSCTLGLVVRRSFNRGRKLGKPASKHGPAHLEFKELLRNIGSQIGGEDLSALAFLCQDVLSRSQLEQVSSGIDLFRALRKRRCITEKRLEFLYRILRDCGRLDLGHLVDSYVYLNLNHEVAGQPPTYGDHTAGEADQKAATEPIATIGLKVTAADAEHSSDGEAFTLGGGRNYLFRTSLKQLGDKLGYSDLQSMKVLATCFIPDSKLEKVKTVFDLFVLLEERGKLSADDLSLLEELLDEKQHLVNQLYAKGFGQKGKRRLHKDRDYDTTTPVPNLPVHMLFSSEHLAMNFKRLLRAVGSRLTKHDISQLIFLCPDDVFLAGQEETESGIELLVLLEKRQIISPLEVDFLAKNLEAVGRRDLCMFITAYKRSIPVLPRRSFGHFPELQTPNGIRSPFHPRTIERSVSLDSGESQRRSVEREDVRPLESSTHTSPVFSHHVDPLTEVDGPLQPAHCKQLRELREQFEAERVKHESEMASLTAECLRTQVELQEKNAVLFEKLLEREEAIRTLSEKTIQKAQSLQEELENQRQMMDRLSAQVIKGRNSCTSERREKQVLEAKLRQRDKLIRRLSRRVAEQEFTIRKMALTMKLQICMEQNLVSSEV